MPNDNFAPIRPRNVAILVKEESTVGVDASPGASDAIPFEADGYSYNAPFTTEASNEALGDLVAGAPLVVGQPAEVSIRCRMKGANATYSASVKPPHHTLFETCGKRGLFTAAVSAAAITAGDVSEATLGTGFSTTAEDYRGMPLQLAAGNSGGRLVHVASYSDSKVASLVDVFGSALNTSVTAALPANWTYAGTSPKDASERATDHPSATIYIYEDGILHKFIGCRGSIANFGGNSARPGFVTFNYMGIYAGWSDATMPTVSVPGHTAPVLAMGAGGVDPRLVVDYKELKAASWSLNDGQSKESTEDPNTDYGFGSPELAGRIPAFNIDPLKTFKANRDAIADIQSGAQYPGLVRFGTVAGNRWSLVLPRLQIADVSPGQRGIYRSENLSLRAMNPGRDAALRDGEAVICFY